MTLTKAELADLLFDKVGLNKREAKDMVEAFFEEIEPNSNGMKASNCPVSAIFNCATSRNVLAAIQKQERKSLLLRGAWSLSIPARN